MGLVFSCDPNSTAKNDDPDHVTGLTSKQKLSIEISWEKIRKNDNFGQSILTTLFKRFPNYQKYFPHFKDIPIDDLEHSDSFRTHCELLTTSFSQIVNNLTNLGILTEILNEIGKNHRRHKVNPGPFWDFKEIVIEILTESLSNEDVETWDKALEIFFNMIVGHLELQPLDQ